MGKKKKQGGFISSNATQKKDNTNKFIDKSALKLDEFSSEGNNANVFLSLKYTQHKTQCFSDWTNQEITIFWNFNETIHKTTWQNVYASARKKNKTGLAYTTIEKKQYPKTAFSNNLSEDVTLFELRLNQKIRVHGFRHKSIFYLCWLDREHKLLE
jgi:predicted O-linked N-acetylglucosamine transferase (SPINDLY family)